MCNWKALIVFWCFYISIFTKGDNFEFEIHDNEKSWDECLKQFQKLIIRKNLMILKDALAYFSLEGIIYYNFLRVMLVRQ